MKLALKVAGVFLLAVFVTHFLRLMYKVHVTVGDSVMSMGMSVFCVVLSLVLAAWVFTAAKKQAMKSALIVNGLFFLIVGIVHALRIAFKVPVVVGDHALPMGLSIGAVIVAVLLAAWMFKAAQKKA
jgi:hypothetical protein